LSTTRLTTLIQRLEDRHPGERLGAINSLRTELDQLEAASVADAVGAGLSWTQIGAALGISKQAAHARHSRHPAVASARRNGHDAPGRVMIAGDTRAAIELARREATLRGDAAVDTDHLLIGIVRTDEARIGGALRAKGLSLERLRRAAGERAGAMHAWRNDRPRDGSGRRPISPHVRRVLERALRRAGSSGAQLDVDAVLDELLREPRGGAARALARLRVSRVELRAALNVG
jgi:hypothetical protein